MPLDSDVINADTHLHVEFYTHNQDGPWKGKPFVRIVVPGDKTNVIDQPVREDHKRRFNRQWLFYQMKSTEGQVIGTPLVQWHRDRPDEFNEGQLAELTILKFQTVEQLAMATDGQIMRVGMGATGLRERAKAYLAGMNAQARGAELEKAQGEIETLKKMVAQLAEGRSAPPAPTQHRRRAGWPKGKARPKKVKADVNNDNAPAGAAGL